MRNAATGNVLLVRPSKLSAVAHAPDGAVPILAKEKGAIFCNGDSHRATPDFAFGRDKTSYEILVFPTRFACRMIEWHAHDFVAGAFRPVP